MTQGRTARLADELSQYMAAAATNPLPADVDEKCRLHLLDSVSAAASGLDLLPGRKALEFARRESGAAEATVIGSRTRVSAAAACFANAMMAHADETDDSHSDSRSHPGCCVVPAALAMAARRPATTGDELLRAVALGYDVGTRVVRALGAEDLFAAGHSTHAFAGVFGAAAAAGSVLKFTPKQFRWLLSYAAQQAAGILAWRNDPEHIQKSFVFSGMPARNGFLAAWMVEAGFTGADDVFGGPNSIFLPFGKSPAPHLLVEELGCHFALMKTTIKKWSVGSPGQPLLDMGKKLVAEHDLRPEDVEHLTMRISPLEAVASEVHQMPNINVRHLMSLMLTDRTVTFASCHDFGRMEDPVLLDLQKKITLIVDAEIGFRRPVIIVQTTDGERYTLQAEAVRGSPANPMDRAEVIEKSVSLVAPRFGLTGAKGLVANVFALGAAGGAGEDLLSHLRTE